MSRTTMNRVGAAAAAAAVMIAGTGTAFAHGAEAKAKAVKPFVNNQIVTQASIGGYSIGESPSAVRRHFAKKSCTSSGCVYAGHGYQAQVNFGSKPNGTKSTVDLVSLSTTTGKDAATRVRTSSGVRLGATYAKARKGLAHVKYYGTKKSGYFFIGKGTIGSTDTTIYITNGVVNLINIQRIDHVG